MRLLSRLAAAFAVVVTTVLLAPAPASAELVVTEELCAPSNLGGAPVCVTFTGTFVPGGVSGSLGAFTCTATTAGNVSVDIDCSLDGRSAPTMGAFGPTASTAGINVSDIDSSLCFRSDAFFAPNVYGTGGDSTLTLSGCRRVSIL